MQKTDFFQVKQSDPSCSLQSLLTGPLQNILYGMSFERGREEQVLVSPGEETRWLPALLAPAVTYVPAANMVVVPEYLLQPPFFHPSYPIHVNLGGLGVALAVAMVEGAAGRGAAYTAAGRLLAGGAEGNFTLGRPAGSALERASGCLAERWGAAGLDTPDQLARSRHSAATRLAGLEVALAALDSFLHTEAAALLPALEHLDPQAVLLLQHARLQCAAGSLEARDLARTTTPALLPREQLLGELATLAQFQHYFFCEEQEDQCGPVI